TALPHQDRLVFVDSATLREETPDALLDRLEDLGARTLYLYAATQDMDGGPNPVQVRDELGGDDGLDKWVRAARLRGFDVIVDLELNHVSESSPLVEAHPDWFHPFGAIRDYSDARELVFHDIEGTRDFAQENPAVSAYLIGAATSFVDRAPISGLGFQSARHVPIPFWAELVWASADSVATRFRTVATWLSGNPRTLALVLSEAGFSEVLDVPSHFALFETVCDGAPPERLASIMYADRRYTDPTRLVTWLDHPGIPPIDERCEGNEPNIRSVLALQHGLRGRPAITERVARCAGSDECGRGAHLRALFDLREQHPVLFSGETRLIAAGLAGLLFLRVGREEVATVAYNASDTEALVVPLPLGVQSSTLQGSYGVRVESGRLTVEPGESGIAVFRRPAIGALEWSEPTVRSVQIRVEGAPVAAEGLVLVGDHEAFGDWESKQGLRLTRDGTSFTAAIELPRGAASEIRIVALIDG
ncbi:MAG: hypothetical protein AAF658_18120, partial [Myxococcota bacterium]